MSDARKTIITAYGRLDEIALQEAQHSYDTSTLLRIVDDLDKMLLTVEGRDGLRDRVLRLHGMAHSVINGAGLSVSTNAESLPELAGEIIEEAQEVITKLQRWIAQIEPLAQLSVRN
ncbi:MAG TPA: Tn3 family transposase post-transcriptional regulator TnpC [Noviherbaspirillum sp.]|nr:Tn3 family transposase post-transcriptional regulator TnpC [Noviherbaspirillum sp.]